MRSAKPSRAGRTSPTGWAGTARFLVRGYLRLLPGRRGAAATGLARDLATLVSGSGPAPTYPPGDPPADPVAVLRARDALAAGDLERAAAVARSLIGRHPDSLAGLAVRREVEERQGEWTAALLTIRTMRSVADSPDLERAERRTVGLLCETDPRWSLRPAGPPLRPEDRSGLVVKVSAGAAVPNGPLIVTTEDLDGTERERFDLTAAWGDSAPDESVEAGAWLATRAARRAGAGLIHAGPGARGYETMLAATAVGGHLGIPVVVDAPPPTDAVPADSEAARRRRATEDRCLARADAVIAPDGARAELVDRGVAPDRIVTVAPGGGPGAAATARRAAYDTALGLRPA